MTESTDNNATYNLEDTFENNLFKIMGSFIPDNIEEAQTMQFQIMKLFIAFSSSVIKEIRNVDRRKFYVEKGTITHGPTSW